MQNSKKTSPHDKLAAVKAIYGGARYKKVARRYRVRRETVDEWCRILDARAAVVFAHGATLNAAEKLRGQLAAAQAEIVDLKAKVDEQHRELLELRDPEAHEEDGPQDDDADLPAP